jgi:hypothetical protein
VTIHASPNRFSERLSATSEAEADAALLSMSKLRDELVLAGERVAAELVESAIQTLEDACRGLLSRSLVQGDGR